MADIGRRQENDYFGWLTEFDVMISLSMCWCPSHHCGMSERIATDAVAGPSEQLQAEPPRFRCDGFKFNNVVVQLAGQR